MTTTEQQQLAEEDEFRTDLTYLRGLADFLLETGTMHHITTSGDSIENQLMSELSPAARKAVFGNWE
jgi:hypothetical protein